MERDLKSHQIFLLPNQGTSTPELCLCLIPDVKFNRFMYMFRLHTKRRKISDGILKTKMSEKWETVGTGKSTSRKVTTGSKASSTKPAAKKEKMVYTMEDILPASSVVNTFASAFDPVPTPKSPKKEAKYVYEHRKSPEKTVLFGRNLGKITQIWMGGVKHS